MTYTFKCEEHGEFEVEQTMKDTTKTYNCPECDTECNKVIQVCAFKGFSQTKPL